MTKTENAYMPDRNKFCRDAVLVFLFLLPVGFGSLLHAQDQSPMMIQATAMGTSTQLGKMINVNIHINQFSTEDDRKTLIAAFKRSGQDGLIDALEHMKGKGRFSTPYGVGNEVKYIIE